MSKVLKRLYLGDVVKSFGTKQLRKLTTEEPINDPYGLIGTWVFDNYINSDVFTSTIGGRTSKSYAIDFTSNGNSYSAFSISSYASTASWSFRYGSTSVYTLNVTNYSWSDDNFKTIKITGGDDIASEVFATWLKAGARKQ